MFFYHDYETYCDLDIGLVGAHQYVNHASFRPLILTYALNNDPVSRFEFDSDHPLGLPEDALRHLEDPGVKKVHHGPFDRLVTNRIRRQWSGEILPAWQCIDTSVLAAEAGLPFSLDGASTAMKLPIRKDPIGKLAIIKFCTPKNGRVYPDEDPELWAQFLDYAGDDTEVCRLLHQRLPPLSATEQELYELDATINDRGIRLDLPAVRAFEKLGKDVIAYLDNEIRTISGGAVAGVQSHAQVAAFLGVASVAEEPLNNAIKHLTGTKLEVAQLRQRGSRTSALKLPKMLSTADVIDNRSRGCLHFCGTKTKRWAGRAWQPHNLPRQSYKPKEVDAVVLDAMQLEFPDFLAKYPDPLRAVSMCLRGFIVPAPGNMLGLADYSQIEARLVAWYSGQWDALDIYESGGDIYREMAADVYNIPVEEVTGDQRFLGKLLILSSGYGQGGVRLQASLATSGVTVTEEEAKEFTNKFRERWSKIPEFWWALKNALFTAFDLPDGEAVHHCTEGRHGGKRYTGLSFGRAGSSIYLEIATGLRCWFHGVRVVEEQTPWDKTQYHTVIQARNYKRNGEYSFYTVSHMILAENVCSMTARELMSAGMKRVEAFGPEIIMTVHDEVVFEVPEDKATESVKKKVVDRMCVRPTWGQDIPLAVEANWARRYAKL